jgi:transposase-like protein
MARGKAHSDETKAQILAALLTGEQPADVARRFGLNESTVRTWGKAGGVDFAQVRAEKKASLFDLIGELASENARTLIVHAQLARSPQWFDKQDAHGMAVFDGVMADKTLRILEAAAAALPLEKLHEG